MKSIEEIRQTVLVIGQLSEERDIYNAVMTCKPGDTIIVIDEFTRSKVCVMLDREEKRSVTIVVQQCEYAPAWIISGQYHSKQCFIHHEYEGHVYAAISWGSKLDWLPTDSVKRDESAASSLSEFPY
jgi:hypothetical protein